MKEGYIRIARAIEDWRWSDDPTMVYFWLRILILANWRDKAWRNKVIKRGSFVTTLASLSTQLNLSVKQIRTCLDRLRAGGEVSTNTANNYTLITICKYDSYQCQSANEWQMNDKCEDKSGATTKEEYNTSYSIQEGKNKKKNQDAEASRPKSSADSPDYDFVMDLWNETMTKVPKVRSLTSARKDKIRLRIKEMGGAEKAKELLAVCFKKIEESDFCNGTSGKWTATFDWFFDNEKNWLKVYEGNYDNRKPQSRIQQYADTANRFNALMDELYGPDDNGTANGAGYTPDEQ